MKQEIQAKIYEETKDLNHEEFAQYVRDKIDSSRFSALVNKREPASVVR
jgi:hypothetical protein